MINLIKDKQYRITETDGTKYRATFLEELEMYGIDCFKFWLKSLILDKTLIAKIEEVEEPSIDDEAREKGCWEEYCKYGTINEKLPRQKFIYTEIYNKESK